MNNALGHAAQTALETAADMNQYITFKLAGYLFALPSADILKIVATPAPSQGGMVSMGLVQLEQYSIQTIDLPQLLNLEPVKNNQSALESKKDSDSQVNVPSKNPPFLMVLQDAAEVLWGIAVNAPPDLMDIPDYALKPVPPEKRMTRALRWVSHVVTYDLGSDRHTLLLLDLSALLDQTASAPIEPENNNFLGIEPPLEMDELSFNDLEISALEISTLEIDSASSRKDEMYA